MLYRRERRIPIWLVLVATLVVALPLGFVLGRLSSPRPSLADLLQPSIDAVREAQGTLDIVELEYARARSPDGASDTKGSRASEEAAAEAAARGLARLRSASALATLYPAAVRDAEAAFERLHRDIVAKAPVAEVDADVRGLRGDLADLRPSP